MTKDAWPDYFIDHINGCRSDNRIANLRDVCQQVNAQNRSKPAAHSKSGYLGAFLDKKTGRYTSSIKDANGVLHRLGCFATPEEAHTRYMEAKASFHQGVGAHINNRKAETTCLEEVQARMAA